MSCKGMDRRNIRDWLLDHVLVISKKRREFSEDSSVVTRKENLFDSIIFFT
ncbi:hypothetical protein HanLR1_Chr03g0117031 [Helianthus annuus]|nr:hypothetical protein HanLR1_Chr03g0117031 [Helianthus annuus]